MVHPVAHLRARGGADRRKDAYAAGVDPDELRRALDRRQVVAHPGWVVGLPDAPADVVLARRVRGVLCDLAAARWWGLPVLGPARDVTIAIGRGASRRQLPGAELLRRDVRPADRDPIAPVTTALATVLDCARRLPFLPALVVAEAAACRGLVSADDVLTGVRDMSGPGSRRARDVARLVDPRCESLLETLLRTVLLELGLPFELQVQMAGVGRVDAVVDGRLVVEADGFEHHRGRDDYREDRRRSNALTALGTPLLRLSYEDLVHRRARTTDLLRTAATRERQASPRRRTA